MKDNLLLLIWFAFSKPLLPYERVNEKRHLGGAEVTRVRIQVRDFFFFFTRPSDKSPFCKSHTFDKVLDNAGNF